MFADTRYLLSPLPGPPVGSSCHGSLQRFRESFVFQGAVYSMATYHTGDSGNGTGEGVIWNINHNGTRCYRHQLRFFFLSFFPIFFHSLVWDKAIRSEKFCHQLPMYVTSACGEKRGKGNTYLLYVLVCMHVHVEKEEVIKENIPQGGSIVVIQTCMGPSIGSTDTVLRVCQLYWF